MTRSYGKVKAAPLFLLLVVALVQCLLFCRTAHSEDRSTLWEIRNGERRAYLVGSIHMLKPEFLPLGKPFEEAFATSATVVFEADLDELKAPETQQAMLRKAFAREGGSLSRVVGREIYKRADRKAQEVGMSLSSMESFQPWFVCTTMALMKMVQMGYSVENGVDHFFFEKAKNANKEIVGLETATEQIEFLSGLSDKQQEALFAQTIEDLDLFEESVKGIVASWEKGNLEDLERIVLGSFRSHQDLYDKIVVQRNMNWLPKIDSLLNSRTSTLIVVGTAHLLGKDGLVEMLKSRGYQVRQM